MKIITIKQNKSKDDDFISKSVKSILGHQIPPNTIICDDDTKKPLIVFGKFNSTHADIKSWLPKIKYQNNQRVTRVKNNYEQTRSADISFGFKPQRPIFGLPASACILNKESPKFYAKAISLGLELMSLYKTFDEEKFNKQINDVSIIDPRWRIPGTIFTQGIVNNTVNLDYHYDRGNIKDCWSCMAVFQRGIIGGELVLPSLNAHLKIEDETFVLFNGQNLLHGVAPIKKMSDSSGRYSIVFYALEAMKNCGTYEEEINKSKKTTMKKISKND